jgi:hypothetical protein
MFVCGVIVDDDVNCQFGGRSGVNNVEEANELLMAMAHHALVNDLAFEDVEGGEQGRGAVTFVVVGERTARPFLIGKPGWVRSSAWIWLFSSTDRTMAWSGGLT